MAELSWQGWQNYQLRNLAHGRFSTIVWARSIREANFLTTLQSQLRKKGFDLDVLAEQYAKQQQLAPSSNLDDGQRKTWRVDQFVSHLVEGMAQCHVQDLKAAHDTIRQLQHELHQARSGLPSSAVPSTGGAKRPIDEPDSSQPAKRARSKQSGAEGSSTPATPDGLIAKALTFSDPVKERVLANNAPATPSSQAIGQWIARLKLPARKVSVLQEAVKSASASAKQLSSEQAAQLPDRAAEFGLPVSLASKAKSAELLKILLVCASMTE